MVYIKSIKLSNFKCYHYVREIGPLMDTNAIVGPNGTGKSNILDAITFALGDINKNLRVDRLKDLIYTSSSGDMEKECSVSVELMFTPDPTSYHFERTIQSNGNEGFLINGVKKTKTEYIATLEKYGIFAKHDNFVIRQGSITKMVKDGELNRTKFIDSISGSGALEEQYDDLQQQYDKFAQQLREHQDFTQYSHQEVQRLSVAQGRQKDIEESMKKLADVKMDYYLLQLYPVEKGIEKAETDAVKRRMNLEKQLTAAGGNEIPEDIKEAELKETFAEVKRLKKNKDAKESDFQAAERINNDCNGQISHLEKKVKTSEKVVKSIQKKVDEVRQDKQDLEKRISELAKDIENLEKDYRRRTQKNLDEAGLADYYSLQKVVEEDKITEKLKKKQRELETLEVELQACNETLEIERKKFQMKENELALIQNNNAEDAKHQNLFKQIEDLELEIQQAKENESKRIEYKKEQTQIEGRLVHQEINKVSNKKAEIRNKLAAYFATTYPGKVYGILGKLCQPVDKSYLLAKTRVFQKWNNAFVVNSPDTAAECIKYVKEMRYPPQKFIPVDETLRVRKVTAQIQTILDGGKAQLIRDFIELNSGVDPAVGRAIDFVCGTILICNTPDEASNIAYNQRGGYLTTVSKDGTICHKNGKIAGGAKSLSKEADQFNQEELEQLMKRRDELQLLLRELPQSAILIQEKQNRLVELRKTLDSFEKERPTFVRQREKRVKDIQNLLEKIQATIDEKSELLKDLEKDKQELEDEIKKLTSQREAFTKKTFAKFCKEHGISNLDAFENEDVQQRKEHGEKIAKMKEQMDKLTNELKYLENSNQGELAKAQETLEGAQKDLAEAQLKSRTCRDDESAKHAIFVDAMEALKTSEEELHKLKKELAGIKAKNKKIQGIKLDLAQIDKEKQSQIDSLCEQLHRLFFECRVNQLTIPLINGDFKNVELFEGDTAEPTAESTQPGRLRAVDCKIDYTNIRGIDEAQLSDDSKRDKVIKNKKKEMTEIENQITIKQAGAMSADDYNERIAKARSKENEVLQKFDQISTSLTTIKKSLDELKAQRRDLFMKAFEQIQKDVDYFYKALYNTSNAQASLDLMGTGDPFEAKIKFLATPPGKKQTDIEELSGGEKAMAVLALLFAGKPKNINCVLMDEFDEALDRRNLALVTRFMDVSSDRGTQFIFVSHRFELYAHANKLLGSASHCTNSCNYQSIIYCINVQEFTGEMGGVHYDPEAENEVKKKRAAKKEFDEAVKIQQDPDIGDDEALNEKKEFLKLYGGRDVSDFIKSAESEDPFKHCRNNEDIELLKDLITRLHMDDI